MMTRLDGSYNDGIGPYAVFYCERCNREYRSQPNVAGSIAKDITKDALGGALRGIPLFGRAIADNVVGEDPRYVMSLNLDYSRAAWPGSEDLPKRLRGMAACEVQPDLGWKFSHLPADLDEEKA